MLSPRATLLKRLRVQTRPDIKVNLSKSVNGDQQCELNSPRYSQIPTRIGPSGGASVGLPGRCRRAAGRTAAGLVPQQQAYAESSISVCKVSI